MPSALSAIAWLKPCCQPSGVPWPSMIVTFQPIFAPASFDRLAPFARGVVLLVGRHEDDLLAGLRLRRAGRAAPVVLRPGELGHVGLRLRHHRVVLGPRPAPATVSANASAETPSSAPRSMSNLPLASPPRLPGGLTGPCCRLAWGRMSDRSRAAHDRQRLVPPPEEGGAEPPVGRPARPPIRRRKHPRGGDEPHRGDDRRGAACARRPAPVRARADGRVRRRPLGGARGDAVPAADGPRQRVSSGERARVVAADGAGAGGRAVGRRPAAAGPARRRRDSSRRRARCSRSGWPATRPSGPPRTTSPCWPRRWRPTGAIGDHAHLHAHRRGVPLRASRQIPRNAIFTSLHGGAGRVADRAAR